MGPNVAATAHAGPSDPTVYATAEVVRVAASGGGFVIGAAVDLSARVSAGIDGQDVSVAGFGLLVGP